MVPWGPREPALRRLALALAALVVAAQLACVGGKPPAGDDTDARSDDTEVYRPSDTKDTGEVAPIEVEILDQPFRSPQGEAFVIEGVVHLDGRAAAEVTLTATSSIDGALPAPTLADDGTFRSELRDLSVGVHAITYEARADHARGAADARIGICDYPPAQTFDANPIGAGWQAFGDAHWDSRGWMEITGNAQSRAGSVYHTARKVDPGDFRLDFRIATGGGINSGADGYAVNIVDVPTLADLADYVDRAGNGGCLGYGVVAGCASPPMAVEAFHVEFDTWQNSGDPVWDPTPQNHVAIAFDGDPGNHVLWFPTTLEDLQWRAVRVEAQGEHLKVSVDGSAVIDQIVPGFHFDGGWIGVSGSTGWATNEHRFDDLRILSSCTIPE